MEKKQSNLITRRQAILSLGAITAATCVIPKSVFGAEPVKNKLRFAVLGDWGSGDDDQFGIAKQMFATHRQKAFDFVLAAGDNIYPDGSGRHFGPKFEQPFTDLLRQQVKFYAVLGNHDVQDGRRDQRDYPLFNMAGQYYYTIKRGDGLAEFFLLDSTDLDSAQLSWLENALQTSTAKWKIAVFHHPLYSSGKKHGSSKSRRRILEPLFTRYGVKAVFAGHDHMYERTKPQHGIQHFVTGAGGKERRGSVDLDSDFRAVSYDEDNHFMMVEIDDRQISYQAITESGLIVDSGVIR